MIFSALVRHRVVVLGLGLLSLFGDLSAVRADQGPADSIQPTQCPICRAANNQHATYGQKATSTLMRGAVNTAFGWTELLVQPTAEVNTSGNLALGIGKGVGLAIKRTALGVGELLTFWTPKGQKGYFALAENCPICFPTAPQRMLPHPPSSASPATSSRSQGFTQPSTGRAAPASTGRVTTPATSTQ